MADKTFLNWPFFEDHHRALAAQLEDWATDKLASVDHSDTDTACRHLVTPVSYTHLTLPTKRIV